MPDIYEWRLDNSECLIITESDNMGLLDDFNVKMRVKGSPISTRKTYRHWVERFIRHCRRPDGGWRHPSELDKPDIESWLTFMAMRLNVSPSTQNLALQSVLTFYRVMFDRNLEGINALRARKPDRMPTFLSIPELTQLFGNLQPVPLVGAQLQTACGLRVGEMLSIRIKDFDFDREQIIVRSAKGAKDRATVFPKEMHESVRWQMKSMRVLYESDRRDNQPGVSLPYAFCRKCTSAATDWAWFYLFASDQISRCPDRGTMARHHMDASNYNKNLRAAARKAMIPKRVSSHVLRHAFGTHMVSCGTDIRTLQSMMGHSDIRTTQIYLHCDANTGVLNKTPFANLLANPGLVRELRSSQPGLRRFPEAG
jgi:integron integrase